MQYDFNTIDALYEAIFGCEYNVNGHTVDPSIVPPSGYLQLISDDMEIADLEFYGNEIVAFDYYHA